MDKVGAYISSIVFNNGEKVNIKGNDIVVFVGPNNAGKSQSLNDIYKGTYNKSSGTVIPEISISKYSNSIIQVLDKVATKSIVGNRTSYSYQEKLHISDASNVDNEFQNNPFFGAYRYLFVAMLNTQERLAGCFPPALIMRNALKKHPIQYAAFEPSYRKWLSSCFRRAFGKDLIPNTQYGSGITLSIGEPVKFTEDFEDEQSRQEKYADILSSYKQVHEQGDGVVSFTSLLLYLMMDNYCTYLIDEPELFLHPPQAYIMGQIIGETLSDSQQAFISTHSEEIIKGLMEKQPDRIKIIRITREGDVNYFSILDNEDLKSIWNDSLLKHSNIMNSLFHKNVVICESDSDCNFYSIISRNLKQNEGKFSETFFIHCGGKHRMAKIVKALLSLNIDVKTIVDIDVLNDEKVLSGIIDSCNALIGTVSAACVAMICVIGSQFIDKDGSSIVSHDAPGSDKVSAAISTTVPIIAEEGNAETTAPADSADTTRPAEGGGTDDTTVANDEIIVVAVTTTTDGNYTYPSGGMVTDTAATTAAYTTKSMVVVDQSFEEATKPVTEPPAPEITDEAMLTNAETEPTYDAEQTTVIVTTAPPTTPKNGETSGNMIYAIGFGWVVNEGGGGEGSTNDEMYCNGNKILLNPFSFIKCTFH